jgi:sugar O-acyltransferase (sialic acid O-acetyltransferase NeuD family)
VIDLMLLAASGLAREVIAADQDDYRVIGILDDDVSLVGQSVSGVDVVGPIHLASQSGAALLVCVGSGAARRDVVQRLRKIGIEQQRFGTLIDRSVRIPDTCTVASGSILLAGTVLTTDVRIGSHVVIMPHGTLTHDCVVHDFATLAAGVRLGGDVRVGEACYLGMSSSVREHANLGDGCVVGMGAVALGDIPAGETWVGAPAAPIRSRVPS